MNNKGGRPKGSKNIKSFDAEILAAKLKVDPLEILLNFAKGDWKALGYDNEVYVMENAQGGIKIGYTISPQMRLDAANYCMKFLYSQKKTPEQDQTDQLLKVILEDYTKK